MKKILLFTFICILFTGCDKKEKFECTKRSDEDKVTIKILFEIKNETLDNSIATMTYDEEETAKSMCEVFTAAYTKDNVKCENNAVTVQNYQQFLNENYLGKDKLKEYYEEREYSCN